MTTSDTETALDVVPEEFHEKVVENNDLGLSDVFTPAFVGTYSDFESIGDLFDATSWDVSTVEELDEVPLAELDEHVAANSDFDSRARFARAATDEFIHNSTGY